LNRVPLNQPSRCRDVSTTARFADDKIEIIGKPSAKGATRITPPLPFEPT
jgi:hypothetical protein